MQIALVQTRYHGGRYRADNGNLRQFEATYRHGTMFTPTQIAYQKAAMGKESLKL